MQRAAAVAALNVVRAAVREAPQQLQHDISDQLTALRIVIVLEFHQRGSSYLGTALLIAPNGSLAARTGSASRDSSK